MTKFQSNQVTLFLEMPEFHKRKSKDAPVPQTSSIHFAGSLKVRQTDRQTATAIHHSIYRSIIASCRQNTIKNRRYQTPGSVLPVGGSVLSIR